jgi:hypothetical protein
MYLTCLRTYAMNMPRSVAVKDTTRATTTLLRIACQAWPQLKRASYHLRVNPPQTYGNLLLLKESATMRPMGT